MGVEDALDIATEAVNTWLEKLSSEGQIILMRLDPYGECQPKILNPKLL